MLFWIDAGRNPERRHTALNEPILLNNDKTSFPVPAGIPNMLFYLQRDPDANTVVYQLNLTEQGALNEAEPVKAFWIRYEEKGQQKELNYIHRKFAYGLHFKRLGPERHEFRFVSHDTIRFELTKGKDGNFKVNCSIFDKSAYLKKMYVRIEGGSFWAPNVRYVDFTGIDEATGKEITRRYIP
jgi:hypothetical protein